MFGFERAWALAGLAVVLPVLWWWHRRRSRPRARVVSSVTLWSAVAASSAPRRRRSMSAELVVAMLTATALVVALAGPVRTVRDAAVRWLVVVDRSASMAHRGAETAYARAATRLRTMLEAAPTAPIVDVIAVPATAQPASVDSLAKLVAAPVATDGAFDRAVRAAADGGATVIGISDRPVPADLATRVGWIQVPSPTRHNAGVVWVRPADRPVAIGVLNAGERPAPRVLVLERAGAVRTVATFDLEPGETWDGTLPSDLVLRDGDRLRLAGDDAFPLDDVVTVVGERLRMIDVYADEPVPPSVIAAIEASAGLTAVRRRAMDPHVAAGGRAALYWRCSPPGAVPRVAVVFAAEGVGFDGLAFGPTVDIAGVRRDPVPEGEISPTPSRVVRVQRVSGVTSEWRVLAAGLDADGAERPLIARRGGHLAILLDPIDGAPGWVREPAFPALFFEHFERVRGLRATGVLAASESRLAAPGASAGPPRRDAQAVTRRTRSYAIEALAIALLGLVGSLLGPVSRGAMRSAGRSAGRASEAPARR